MWKIVLLADTFDFGINVMPELQQGSSIKTKKEGNGGEEIKNEILKTEQSYLSHF